LERKSRDSRFTVPQAPQKVPPPTFQTEDAGLGVTEDLSDGWMWIEAGEPICVKEAEKSHFLYERGNNFPNDSQKKTMGRSRIFWISITI
jgi:hypothetical protein